jgi:hypothetical protein
VATKEDYEPVEIKSKKKTKGGRLGEIAVEAADDGEQKQQVFTLWPIYTNSDFCFV